MIIRAILPDWAISEYPHLPKVQEGDFDDETIETLNKQFYNIYFLPNSTSLYDSTRPISGADIDQFSFVFVDMDLKDETYESKESFYDKLNEFILEPSMVVDSGNGIHAYWRVSDLDSISYLKLQRRLMRYFRTDPAVGKIYQLMRLPGTINTKIKDSPKPCEVVFESETSYICEQLDKALPMLTTEDEQYCKQHYNKINSLGEDLHIDTKLPLKWDKLIRENSEVQRIWAGGLKDRSRADFRLAHIMYASGFTKSEALTVLANTAKAAQRAPVHQASYASNIVDQIWFHEEGIGIKNNKKQKLSESVREILQRYDGDQDAVKGVRFPCHSFFDATKHGFRLGQVIGLVAGSGVGKTTIALNMFMGFVQNNPNYEHFYIPLEQPSNEIAERWRNMCGDNVALHSKVHVLSNYDENGTYRNLSLRDIWDYLLEFKKEHKINIGCVVIDHIGVLKAEDTISVCKDMKAFAIETNTLLVMQSQAPREKAGIGDLELNKDAAYGTVFFESYCDYLITVWQPLKRCYSENGCPTVTAFKFCKIRHKKVHEDQIHEDLRYKLHFDPKSERLRELTQLEEKSFDFFNTKATNLRKTDRQKDVLVYHSINWTQK